MQTARLLSNGALREQNKLTCMSQVKFQEFKNNMLNYEINDFS